MSQSDGVVAAVRSYIGRRWSCFQVQWVKFRKDIEISAVSIASIGAVASAILSGISACQSSKAASNSEETAVKVAAIKAVLAFKDDLTKQPGAAACMYAINKSQNKSVAFKNLIEGKPLTLDFFKGDDGAIDALEICIAGAPEDLKGFDELKVRSEGRMDIPQRLSNDIIWRSLNHLNAYEGLLIYYVLGVGDKSVICGQSIVGYNYAVKEFVGLIKENETGIGKEIQEGYPSVLKFYDEKTTKAGC